MSVGLSVQRDKDFGHLGEGADAAAVGEDWKRGRNPAAELSPRAAVLLPGYARMQDYFPAGWRTEGWCLQQWCKMQPLRLLRCHVSGSEWPAR